MITAQEIAGKYAEDQMVQAMLEYGREVVDVCVAIAMAVDITNTRAKIMGTKQDDVWREVLKIKDMLK